LTSEEDFSPEDWGMLRLAGAFNGEQARWNVIKGEGTWLVVRETDEEPYSEFKVMAEFKANGEAHEARSLLEDIAAAKAFINELNNLLEEG
jgi:hypothetical protein